MHVLKQGVIIQPGHHDLRQGVVTQPVSVICHYS